MMIGQFLDSGQAVILITVQNENNQQVHVTAVVDTGFTGALLLPQSVVEELNLQQLDITEVVLADGAIARLNVYEVIVLWNDEERAVLTYAGDGNTLIGVGLLRGNIGTFEFFEGGTVRIEPVE